jgi:predicted negative regulator of RcsB-dependent stress response
MAGLVILAVLVLAAWFVVASGKRKEQFAARSLNQARAAAEAGNLPLASSELQKLISTYKGTDAASGR